MANQSLAVKSFFAILPSAVPSDETGFAKRMSYARLAYHFRMGEAPSIAEIARAAEKTGEWLAKWIKDDKPPPGFRDYEPIGTFLGASWEWLFWGRGAPPNAELWKLWVAQFEGPPLSQGGTAVPDPSSRSEDADAAKRKGA